MNINFYINPSPMEIRGRNVQGAKRPGARRPGVKRPGGETSRGGNGFGAKRPGTTLMGNFNWGPISRNDIVSTYRSQGLVAIFLSVKIFHIIYDYTCSNISFSQNFSYSYYI